MKKLMITLLLLFPLCLFAQTNFSGKWALDKAKSDFNGLADEEAAAVTGLTITPVKDSIKFDRYYADGHHRLESLAKDGKGSTTDLSNATAKTTKTSKLSWNEARTELTISSHYQVDDGREWEYARTEVFKLSADGQTLTVQRSTTLPDRTQSITMAYEAAK